MKIKLGVSKEKNLQKLKDLCEDPAFLYTILKNMGYNSLPDDLSFELCMLKKKKNVKK